MEAPIHATSVLINLLGSIAVLLWGLRMVQGGVRQAFGARLRRAVMAGTRHPLLGMGMGIWVTTLLQS
ncbi:MAG: Na/Pi cotransporter family protein, partial [Gammaproteobacteria bacterium]|nr:Na/Pi cotransporter family protein [Gammaproteobacteria bacterium]NIR97126.1 Na/Pi cotransporter family protein [Gammaproteobacteria bacterium]NIT62824.1 Na/Pi cotransporter family protein [Gammaproteobacteria bacterium]NIV20823.1 Na/Pi cotransporter family protein [Gammaproteobacteria bacterium]NIX11321.1 Na/Pi cotransporter family protein [Gammaproteobacteria bacterium]